ncbi:MADS-box transcription factor 23 [Platanthera guangdongensis]|uniref:MADS-box transcription factor 23 n=1 Tax=Platanthera guangdongensis TaxID=2320717 RepID=A0ABR2MVQ9_9ASPA
MVVGRGRKKTGMKLIEDKTARDVCFCKRRRGLFKKARELSVLCGAKVGVLVFSTSGKANTFDAPSLETLIARQLGPGEESESPPPAAGADKGENLAEKEAPFWWERVDMGSMRLDELKTFASSVFAAREELFKQLEDGGHVFDATQGIKMMDKNVFFHSQEPSSSSSITHGSNEMPLMTDIFFAAGQQSNEEQMKRHQELLGGDPGAAAGQMLMDESFFLPNSWPSVAIAEQMLMNENFFIPSLWSSPTDDIGGQPQMPISFFKDEPSGGTDGRRQLLAAPTNLLPCNRPSVDDDAAKHHASFQHLTWTDLFMQRQWI